MKKIIVSIVVIVLVIIGIVVFGRSGNAPTAPVSDNGTPTPYLPATQTDKVSSKTSKYQNAELGFAVDYPTAWEAESTDNGVRFIMPTDQNQVSTVGKLEADVNVSPGKCAFPPVTTIKDRGTLAVGSNPLKMISMSNTVQGRNYFDRLYTLQSENICYTFWFSSITLSPESKNLSGSKLTQAQNNNKAIINTADSDFTGMVKSFIFVQQPAGKDESQVSQ